MGTPAPALDLNAERVQVGTAAGPGIYAGPPGQILPRFSSIDDEIEAPWLSLGYLSDDGPTISMSIDTEDLTPWQSAVPIRTIITAKSVTAQFVMWEISAQTVALYFDTDVPEVAAGVFDLEVRTDTPQHVRSLAIDAADGDRHVRFMFPRAMLTDAGDMQIQRGAAIPLDVTLSTLASNNVLCWIQGNEVSGIAPEGVEVRQSRRGQAEARHAGSSAGGAGGGAGGAQ